VAFRATAHEVGRLDVLVQVGLQAVLRIGKLRRALEAFGTITPTERKTEFSKCTRNSRWMDKEDWIPVPL
jgi:hypothetical protein